ncbi:MAG: hypothetical protein M9924_07090 [Rhizobiaceae bacterium]|nr:hypothetical protein [Rhizobiaceae bacterium]
MIRRMVSSPATRRYAASLPQFEVPADLPPDMDEMLRRLEKLENRRR